MIEPYLNIVAEKLQAFTWLDKAGGAVQTVQRKTKEGKINTFPVAVVWDVDDCKGKVEDMVPDDQYAAMTYFELGKPKIRNIGGGKNYYDYTAQLVCWYNSTKLTPNDPATLGALLSRELANIHKTESAVCPKLAISTEAVRIDPKVFAKYSYDEAATQYLFHPYAHFVIDLRITAVMLINCETLVVNKVDNPC